MTRSTPVVPRAVAGLIHELDGLGVTLPAKVTDAADVLDDAVSGELVRAALAPVDPGDLLGIDWADLITRIRDQAITSMLTDQMSYAAVAVADRVAEAAVCALRDSADSIINALRPRFDTAAQRFTRPRRLVFVPALTPPA